MGRSQSHQINDESYDSNRRTKHRKKPTLVRRQRSQTAEQNQMEQILRTKNVNNYGHVQTRTHGNIYTDNNAYIQGNNLAYFPPTNPQMSASKSTPTHITISQPHQENNQFYLQQSNTQGIDDLDHEIAYNMCNHMHTPSSGTIPPNMLMVNAAYSPYVNHYNEHTPSTLTPNSTASVSPYTSHNEYYGRGNNMVNNTKHNGSYSTNINRNQIYYIQTNGHEMYQPK